MNAEILLEDFFVHTIIPPDRTIDTGLALKEIGYLDAVRVRKELTYSDMLEITIRLASQEGVAVDYLDGVRYGNAFSARAHQKAGSPSRIRRGAVAQGVLPSIPAGERGGHGEGRSLF